MPTNLKQITSGISGWPEDERPRERLLTRGPHALSDAELLAILLRVGMQGKSAVEMGRELLIRFGSVPGMMAAPISAWEGIKGLGDAKLAQLQAALELGRRASLPGSREKTIIKSTRQAAEYFTSRLRGLAEEHFRVAYLNRQGRLLGDALIAQGTVDQVHPPIRSIVAQALQANASALGRYAVAHFERVNEHLAHEGSTIRYKFNFLTPKSFGTYFQYLREGRIAEYRSELDVKLEEAE